MWEPAVSGMENAHNCAPKLQAYPPIFSLTPKASGSTRLEAGTYFRFAEEMHCPFAAVFSNVDCSIETRHAIYQKITEDRSAQRYRTIPLDLFCDTEVIGNIISSPTSVVGFGPDGTLYTPGREVFRTPYNLFDQPLKELVTKAL